MKFLVLIVIVLGVLWLARKLRGPGEGPGEGPAAPTRPTPPAVPQDMVQCPVCALHLPRADALPGADGRLYCCAEHGRHGGG